jgi:ATP/maltotriose-dependent transcriptional regulator MalT
VAWALLLAGRPADAELELRSSYETLKAIGEVSFLSTVAGILAEALYAQDRHDEADELTRVSEESAGAEDVYSQVVWRSVRAKCLAQQGSVADALDLAREAVTLAAGTDALDLHWHALMSQAEVLRLADRRADADAALHQATHIAERKGNLVAARLSRQALTPA